MPANASRGMLVLVHSSSASLVQHRGSGSSSKRDLRQAALHFEANQGRRPGRTLLARGSDYSLFRHGGRGGARADKAEPGR